LTVATGADGLVIQAIQTYDIGVEVR